MKFYARILILLVCQICFCQGPNAKKIDSLLAVIKSTKADTTKCSAYNQISNFYLYSNIEKGVDYAKKGLALANKINWKKGIGLSRMNLAKHQISKGDFDTSMKNLKIAEGIFLAEPDVYNLGGVYNQFGILNANKGKFPDALDYFFKSLKNFEATKGKNTKLNIAVIYQNIANIYNATENFENSVIHYDKSIALFKQLKGEDVSLAMNIASKGTVYQKQKKYVLAIDTLLAAEKILLQTNEKYPLAFVSSWLGSAYLAAERYTLSIEYSKRSLETITEMGDQVLIAATIQNIGHAYLKKGIKSGSNADISLGFENLSKSLEMNKKSGNLELLLNDYKHLSEYYEYKKDFKASLDAHKNFAIYSDSIYNTKNKQSLKNLEDERTIQLNNKQILLNKITLENKERQKWYLIFGIALLGIIGILLFKQSQNRKKTNEKLQLLNTELDEANKAKTRFFSILNHDLRSPVSNLVFFLQLQKESPEMLDEESKKRMQDKTMEGAENLLNSMEDILQWSKSQMENFKPQPKKVAVSSLFEEVRNHFSSEENIRFTFENPESLQLHTDENYLKTIIRNLTGNAVKALRDIENPTITWRAWQENNQTFLSITDNGKGATDHQFRALYDEKEVSGIKSGLGLHLIRDLAKAIDCKIDVYSKIDSGTTITLKLFS
ncbi:tetratricopeptide repeat-containing sensor histidine kinase [Flavobacterium sp.]